MTLDVVVTADEYCLFCIDWWPLCLTKSEWAAWVQAFAVVITLAIPLGKFLYKKCKSRKLVKNLACELDIKVFKLNMAVLELNKSSQDIYETPLHSIDGALQVLKYFKHPNNIYLEALHFLSPFEYIELNNILQAIDLRAEMLRELKKIDSIMNNKRHADLHLEHQAELLEEVISDYNQVVARIKKI